MAATVFSTQLQKLRKQRGVKQEQLAEYLGVSTQAVSKWENGSYPDGDLLPKIAEYFGVSIDYLYGNETKDLCLEQQVAEYLQKKRIENNDGLTSLDRMKEFLWAMQHSENSDSTTEYRKYSSVSKENEIAGSGRMFDDGFTYMRITEDLEYYCLMQLPKQGVEEYFSNTEELAKLFALLSREENLRILYYMLSLPASCRVRAEAVAESLGIPLESVKTFLEEADNLSSHGELIATAKLVEASGEETIYGANNTRTAVAVILLAAAKDILYSIRTWYGLNWGSGKGWMNREKVMELSRKKSREKEGHE